MRYRYRTGNYIGDVYYTIPANVSGVRLKVQRLYYYYRDDPGPSTVSLNSRVIWSAAACTGCPSIVTASVKKGDVLSFRERRDKLAIFWIELWEHTRWPHEILGLSNWVHIPGRLCAGCPGVTSSSVM